MNKTGTEKAVEIILVIIAAIFGLWFCLIGPLIFLTVSICQYMGIMETGNAVEMMGAILLTIMFSAVISNAVGDVIKDM